MSKPCSFSFRFQVRLTWSFSFSYGYLLLSSILFCSSLSFLIVALIPLVIVSTRAEACNDILRPCDGRTIDGKIDLKTDWRKRIHVSSFKGKLKIALNREGRLQQRYLIDGI